MALSTTTKTTNKQKIMSVGEEVKKLEPFCTVVGNIKWCSHYGKKSMAFLQKLKLIYHMIEQFCSCVYNQKN